ncbi:TonB-dependent siderophore receptor [Nostoc favosum]|uniref:TonB-dependent siderophore receptor n=1 Tax=Nostoc favosum CHAB5714 TaxID=2780399 RepID=A0ABS8IGG6_9NOSO|nr:TonB-dependent siderophore receptor [Nostoc favosum]MCC5603297.1 TonB-dependent siderophore receptor [Nostoc favosum CHAB5714]
MESWRSASSGKCFARYSQREWRSPTLDIYLWLVVSVVGIIGGILPQPGQALASEKEQDKVVTRIKTLSETEFPATSVKDLLSQSPTPDTQSIVVITGVKANPTDKGVEVILETTQGDKLQVANRSTGNSFIANITGGQLRLPNGDAFTFKSEKPLAGITEITVTNVDANTVRVTVVGEKALPTVELFDDNVGLIFTVASTATTAQEPEQPTQEKPVTETPEETPTAQQDDPIELVVTGEQDNYRVPNASTATRTDTPLRDIPRSIQVIPQQVIRDQNANRLQEILENAPGVTGSFRSPRSVSNFFNSRGFELEILRNGAPDTLGADYSYTVTDNIERVEVLKGPASVLFGLGAPGGVANVITKKPLREPFYEIRATAGNFDTYRGAIDLSGPLNDSKTVLYRLNASANTVGSFIDFFKRDTYLVAPSLTWQIGERTTLTFDAEYQKISGTTTDNGLPAEGTILPNPNGRVPRNITRSEPTLKNDDDDTDLYRIGYNLEHRFSENWQLRSSLQTIFYKENVRSAIPLGFLDNKREQPLLYLQSDNFLDSYQFDNYVVGKFSTGRIQHQLVAGFNLYSRYLRYTDGLEGSLPPIDVFNPVYGRTTLADLTDVVFPEARFQDKGLGLYVQDQITLAENLKVSLGGRFDIFRQDASFEPFFPSASLSEQAFSPQVGIVYQPIKPISLYASYSRSFTPASGTASDVSGQFRPERGTQYEIGVKADITDKLSATLALFDITRTNVATPDAINPLRSIQTGEQNSRGVELDLSGEILPGWNIFAGFLLIDPKLTADNTFPVGNQLNNTPRTSLNLWTTYQIQSGDLQGLGVGLGIFYAGERQGDLDNSFQLPSYVRTDASIFYKRNQFRAALNLRNLFDTEYFVSAGGRNRVYLGDPFTVQGSLSWEF